MNRVGPDKVGLGSGAYPRPVGPRFSLAERDRRWDKVRKLMARDGLDAILCLTNSSSWDHGHANGRYLSAIGGNAAQVSVVFPLQGTVTAVTGAIPATDYWLKSQDWVTDIRQEFFNATPTVIARLRELKLDTGKIGIAGLRGVARAPDGIVIQGAYAALAGQLPRAVLVDATALMDEARFVKSEEELSMFFQTAKYLENAVEILKAEARPGVPECVVYGRTMGSLIAQGSEPNTLFLWAAGAPVPPVVATLPSQRPLGTKDVVMVEMDASVCGYRGHVALTTWVGGVDEVDRAMAGIQYEAFKRCCEAMKPGLPMAALVDVCSQLSSGPFQCKPIVHGRGLGNDAPVLVVQARDERTAQWRLEKNSVFVVKPVVSTADGSRKVIWGDTVVVSNDGAKRFGCSLPPLI
jgi:Xaa-Pro aminopeptidase